MLHYLFRHFFRVAHQQCTIPASHGIEMSAGDGRPAAFLADAGKGFGVTWKEIVNRLLRCFGNVTEGVHANLEFFGRMSRAPAKFPIDVNERTEPPGLAADDGDHQGQSQRPGARE